MYRPINTVDVVEKIKDGSATEDLIFSKNARGLNSIYEAAEEGSIEAFSEILLYCVGKGWNINTDSINSNLVGWVAAEKKI